MITVTLTEEQAQYLREEMLASSMRHSVDIENDREWREGKKRIALKIRLFVTLAMEAGVTTPPR